MRRVAPMLVLAAAAALLAGAPARAADLCIAPGAETVRLTPKVRVYWNDGHLYGCIRATGITRHLYGSDHFVGNQYDGVGLVRVAGYHVAFAGSSFCTVCGTRGPSAFLRDVELRTNRRRELGTVRRYDWHETGVAVDALVLDRCGRIAYRAVLHDSYDREQDPDPRLLTWVGPKRRLVDRGHIRRRSIRLDSTSVHWVRDGEQHEAPVNPPC
jgi:hypothetical protein